MLIAVGLLILSIVILYYGAEFSLDASEKVGQKIGLSPFMIGMLLVGFGTSLPEFFVAHIAGIQGKIGMAIGSLVGSNIANMLLILGVCSLIVPLVMAGKDILKQLIIHLLLGLVLIFVLSREKLDLISATPLLAIVAIYLYVLLDEFKNYTPESKGEKFKPAITVIKLLAGFGMLYIGGEILVKSGTDLCVELGVSEYIVSAILLAFGTSFPELVTSILAALKKKETDLIVGNIVGSNLFNCAFILGSLGIYEMKVEGDFKIELIAVLSASAFLLLFSFIKRPFFRFGGFVFLVGYGVMIKYWISAA